MMGKKGSVLDLFALVIILAAVSIVVLIAFNLKDSLLTPLRDVLGSTSTGPDVQTPQQVLDTAATGLAVVDNMFIVVAGGIGIGVVVIAYLTRASPALMIFSVILLIILLVVAAPMSNVFRSMATDTAFSAHVDTDLPMTKLIMANLPVFAFIFGFIILIVVYAKTRSGGE